MKCNRRNFIESCLIVLSSIFTAVFLGKFSIENISNKTLIRPRRHGLSEVGKKYLELKPNEASVQFLSSSLGLSFNETIEINKFKKHIEQDFVKEDVVYVEGWMLSLTEARLAALSYLNKC